MSSTNGYQSTIPLMQNFVNGKFETSKGPIIGDVTNPATGEVLKQVPGSLKEEVDAAIASAQKAFVSWSTLPISKRVSYMFRFREIIHRRLADFTAMIRLEGGKTVKDAEGDIIRGLEVAEYACGFTGKVEGMYEKNLATDIDMMQIREPLGVCVGICPFNFPAMIPLWMIPIAIVTGNSFVLKPSELVPGSAHLLAEISLEAGFPPGVFNIVQGGKDTVDALLDNPHVKAVSFVGSTPIGRIVYQKASMRGIRAQCNMGAKNHAVVMSDCNKELTLNALTAAAFGATGQRCMAISVAVFVGESIQMLPALVQKAANVKLGTDENSDMGPLISSKAKARVETLVNSAKIQGAKIDYQGQAPSSKGNWVGPVVISNVTPEMDVYKEEIFGPVLVCLHVQSLDEAIQLINSNRFGNGTAIFTESGVAARKFQSQIEVGQVGINIPVPVPAPPFGFTGSKDSMWGDLPFYGPTGFAFFTRPKTVVSRFAW
ncbi:methylmalonate-semialdehyde dehydrogenase [Galdieria sulphuraria]|uniref:methylmalonate-semialdehyde dehydrogenase (CoA acylating) n=1 Tax=Galdieria sulphuraria TaxID=130081 RepID=M2Y062_GALSU|nr:methylmalonate-semialdehyde dehydrogenase [Galdieria sulphuraria]EME29278.1 methylmalonate-semialdehyde dehydrogenase [Galdieria sulphuraria]|eukprot:XP_005705798.1 methylmalonate-semialdehyde dehydrogenase [Galdieria sulphuraria]